MNVQQIFSLFSQIPLFKFATNSSFYFICMPSIFVVKNLQMQLKTILVALKLWQIQQIPFKNAADQQSSLCCPAMATGKPSRVANGGKESPSYA